MRRSFAGLTGFLTIPLALGFSAPPALSADYEVDPAHSFISFRIQHLGYSWLHGRFNRLSGGFSHDADNPAGNAIALKIDPASVDTNHAERDKHLRSEDFLDVKKYPEASFRSTGYTGSDTSGTLTGELTLHGVTKPVSIMVDKIGEGPDPWGGHRAGFQGTTKIARKDFGMDYNLGPSAEHVELELTIEGIRKK